MKKYLFLISMILMQFACTEKNDRLPAGLIDKDQMAKILVDVQLAESGSDTRGLTVPQGNIVMASKYDSLFKKHNLSYTRFKASYDYYANHPALLSDIYTEVVNRLTTLQSTVGKEKKVLPLPHQLADSALHAPRTPPHM